MQALTIKDIYLINEQIKKQYLVTGQTSGTVLDPIFDHLKVSQEHRKFIPIAYKAVDRLLAHIEPKRLKAIAGNCIGEIEKELSRDITLDADNHPREGASDVLSYFYKVSKEGDLLENGWIDPDDWRSSVDGNFYEVEEMKLTAAIEAANASCVFQALRIRLELSEGMSILASTWKEEDQ